MDKVGIMLLYKGKWMQEENYFYFKGNKGKGIEVPKTILFEDLLEVIYRICKTWKKN